MPSIVKDAMSTISTSLFRGNTKMCRIKSYPDLGGAPDLLETTDLEDTWQTFVPGVQSVDAMEFTANYNATDYSNLVSTSVANGIANDDNKAQYSLKFGRTGGGDSSISTPTSVEATGADGEFTWYGWHTVRVTGGDVNTVREMVVTCIPATPITMTLTSGNGG